MSETSPVLFFSRHFRRRIENTILSTALQTGQSVLMYNFDNYSVHLATRLVPMESTIAGQKKIYISSIVVVEAKPNYPQGLVPGEELRISVDADVFNDADVPLTLREKVIEMLDGLYDWLEEKNFTEPADSFEAGKLRLDEATVIELETEPCLVTEDGEVDPHFRPNASESKAKRANLSLVT